MTTKPEQERGAVEAPVRRFERFLPPKVKRGRKACLGNMTAGEIRTLRGKSQSQVRSMINYHMRKYGGEFSWTPTQLPISVQCDVESSNKKDQVRDERH